MMTRWKVVSGYVYEDIGDGGAVQVKLQDNAAQIVRDHNRAEAFEAMQVQIERQQAIIDKLLDGEKVTDRELLDLHKDNQAALALAEQVDSTP